MLWSMVSGHLRALRLPQAPSRVVTTETSLSVLWRATTQGARFRLLLVAGLGHAYPRADNNPAGLSLADLSWRFFQANPLP